MIVNTDRRITIERRAVTKHAASGSAVETWSVYAVKWAERRDGLPSRQDNLQQGLERTSAPVRFRFRHDAGIDSTMRVRDGAEILQIVGRPAEIGRREWTEIACEEFRPR